MEDCIYHNLEQKMVCLNCNTFFCIECTSQHRNHCIHHVDSIREFLENNHLINNYYLRKANALHTEVLTGMDNLRDLITENLHLREMGHVINEMTRFSTLECQVISYQIDDNIGLGNDMFPFIAIIPQSYRKIVYINSLHSYNNIR
ncbi:hypothetical protein PPL_04724 [Heterostelium album PN500]|uniref:B box-type domain-containing protein n=1 Tax=Heterostelium pallidum (strain ATCC 26659 / Pp 5 / PN500) TaxID=670386 RepID=D3B8D2_HETP5|nr:hypothetical protein PPL_04724 [Heterostelium album PN500]EFA82300.1 hypothetical protein PPL_04724 [Heterostelium album PN500]|eukprot:XP_020434417.1 hypothetical protein PPL_04724 [Heterostelium album PN500]